MSREGWGGEGGETGKEVRGKEISSDFEQVGRLSNQWACHGKESRPSPAPPPPPPPHFCLGPPRAAGGSAQVGRLLVAPMVGFLLVGAKPPHM